MHPTEGVQALAFHLDQLELRISELAVNDAWSLHSVVSKENYGKNTVPEERGYRAYFFSPSDHIRDVRGMNVSRDVDAIAEAQVLLAKSEYAFAEVYEEWRLVWRSDRERLVA